jgi:hypothetical protein
MRTFLEILDKILLNNKNLFFFKTIANIEYGKYQKYAYDNYLTQFEFERFENETLSRQFALLQTLGTAAMPEEDQTSVTRCDLS